MHKLLFKFLYLSVCCIFWPWLLLTLFPSCVNPSSAIWVAYIWQGLNYVIFFTCLPLKYAESAKGAMCYSMCGSLLLCTEEGIDFISENKGVFIRTYINTIHPIIQINRHTYTWPYMHIYVYSIYIHTYLLCMLDRTLRWFLRFLHTLM